MGDKYKKLAVRITSAEIVEHSVPVCLSHLGVDVEAAEAQFGDLLGKELNSLSRIAEDDWLVDLELREEGIEAVDLKKRKALRVSRNEKTITNKLKSI